MHSHKITQTIIGCLTIFTVLFSFWYNISHYYFLGSIFNQTNAG